MGAALVRKRKHRTKAPWGKRFSTGRVCGADIGSDCRTAGPDPGRDRCTVEKAADPHQPKFVVALSRSTRHHSQKKACKPQNEREPTWPAPVDGGYESKACLIRLIWYLSMRRQSAPIWCGSRDGRRAVSD